MQTQRLIFILLIVLSSCTTTSQIAYQRTGEVERLEHDDKTLLVSSRATGTTTAQAAQYAERKAIENILFKGIPNSNQEVAMVADEGASLRGNASFYEDFIMNNGYEKFILSSLTRNSTKQGQQWTVQQEVSIDLDNMRRYLEKNKIIKKFGL